jgi:hypothetical protein
MVNILSPYFVNRSQYWNIGSKSDTVFNELLNVFYIYLR